MSNSGHRYARFIPDEEINRSAPWQFVAVDEGARAAEEAAARIAASQAAENQPSYLRKIQDAYEAGRQQGYEDGHAEGTREGSERLAAFAASEGQVSAERLAGLVASMGDSLGAAQERIATQVLEMACSLARQVLRRELAADPQSLLPVVREAMGQLVADGRPATVRLNPQDLEALRVPLHAEYAGVAVAWVADAAMPANGCQVEQAGAVIDGRLETRWQRAIVAMGVRMPLEVPEEPEELQEPEVPQEPQGAPGLPNAAAAEDGAP